MSKKPRRVFVRPPETPPPPSAPAASAPVGDRMRYRITGELEVLSPLHVGTGDSGQFAWMAQDGAASGPDVAGLLRDYQDRPYLAGTTLKGLLRRLAEARLDTEKVKALFGEIKHDGGGTMGAVLVRGAEMAAAGDAASMPYAARGYQDLGDGVFIAARTRVERHSGTADSNHLFFQEMVAPGARFTWTLLLDLRRHKNETLADFQQRGQDRLSELACLLGALEDTDGCTIGKGQADGQGRVRLRSAPLLEAGAIQPTDGSLHWQRARMPAPAQAGNSRKPMHWVVELRCPGPFLIADSSHLPLQEDERARRLERDLNDPTAAQLVAQRAGLDQPLIPGASIMGALRTRIEWLAALRRHRAPPSTAGDTAEIEVVRRPADINELSPTQRLFGVTGFRGLLSVGGLTMDRAERWTATSVALDRFSGAPLDQALFASASFLNVQATLRLTLDGRGVAPPSAADIRWVQKLLRDIRDNGLMLGHAGNRGFGWFTCAITQGDIGDA